MSRKRLAFLSVSRGVSRKRLAFLSGLPNGFFLAAVAPKKMPRSAADSDVAASLPKSCRSTVEPAVCPASSPAFAHSRIAGGA